MAQELLGAGFESVDLKSVNKLGKRAIKKYGMISSIAINGHKDFLGIKKVPASSYIVIEFLDFRENIDSEIPANVKRIKTGTIHNAEELEEKKESSGSICTAKKYCVYCGEAILNENAKFCSACGKPV